MSVLDDVRTLEERVTSRLEELRPLVEEYRELERAARRLGIEPSKPKSARRAASSAANGRRSATARSSGGATPRRRRAQRKGQSGSRREQVLALVKERPGITVPQLGDKLKIDPTGLYRVVRGLEEEGAVKKDGKAIHPA
jgi:ribosomal protein S25